MILDSIEQQQALINLVRSAKLQGSLDELDALKQSVVNIITTIASAKIVDPALQGNPVIPSASVAESFDPEAPAL